MRHEYLQSFTVRKHVGEMKRIAVTGSSPIEERSVMIDTCSSVDYFIKAVAVNVADCQRVSAFTVCAFAFLG